MWHQGITAHRDEDKALLDMSLAKPEQLDDFIAFAAAYIGAPEQW